MKKIEVKEELKELFEKLKNEGFGIKIYNDEELGKIEGILYGTDEMFNVNEFYQELITTDGKIYEVYFDLKNRDVDEIDYDDPYKIEEITETISYDNDMDEIIEYVAKSARI